MLNEVLENIKSRRSVRTYTEQQVSAENHYGICKILRMRELCIKFKK